jgi:hypothetical protein
MDVSHVNFAMFALAISGAVLARWSYELYRARPPVWAMFVSLAHLFVAVVDAAAPVRGLVDPHYAGYQFGYLHAAHGWSVTVVAGSVFLAAAAAAFIAIRNRPGPAMWFVAATSAFFTLNLGGSWLQQTLTHVSDNTMQFGEYLTIPALIATPIMFVLFVCPFLIGVGWAPRRARA